ncbi:hypothetical protein [Streptomyces sp. NPDC002537]
MLPEITEHTCTNCGRDARGIFGRWSCTACRTSSPYIEPPASYASWLVAQEAIAPPPRRDVRPHHLCGEVACVCPRFDDRRRR